LCILVRSNLSWDDDAECPGACAGWCQRCNRSAREESESRDSSALACVTSASLSPNNGECDGVAGTPPIADHPKRLDLACSQNHVERTSPGSWGRDNLRRFRKWCISSLHPNHLLNGRVLPTLGCNLLAERASLLTLRPQNVIRWLRRV
jgi:hypothetical protein